MSTVNCDASSLCLGTCTPIGTQTLSFSEINNKAAVAAMFCQCHNRSQTQLPNLREFVVADLAGLRHLSHMLLWLFYHNASLTVVP